MLAHPEDEFLFLFDRPYDPAFVYAENVTPVALWPKARFAPLFYTWFEYSAPRAMRQFGAEVFFSPDSMCSLHSRIRTVMTCHDLVPLHYPKQVAWVHRYYYLFFLPRFLRRAERVLTVSEYVKQDIAETCGISPDKISAVYNGCREVFKPLQANDIQSVREKFSDGRPYFFYTGAIHPRKNLARLIRAFSLFKKGNPSPVKLLLAGRLAWQTEEVQSALNTSEFRDDIRLLGYVPDEELPRLTAAALAMTYVSISEGFGLPLIEAMNCDVPVMAANTSCLPEVAGEAALLVDPFSEIAMASGMRRLWLEENLRADLIGKGRVRREAFSWDQAAEAIYGLLTK